MPDNLGMPLNLGLYSYAPETRASILPPGFGRHIPAGSKLLFVMHYTPNGIPQLDKSEIGLKFADENDIEYVTFVAQLTNEEIHLPPGAKNIRYSAQLELDRDYGLLSLVPHMHYRGRSFLFAAIYPDQSVEPLLSVPQYNFNWQYVYQLAEPIMLPRGTIVHCEGVYDNSAENPLNPDPTAEVRFGEQSTDEMLDGFLELTLPIQDFLDIQSNRGLRNLMASSPLLYVFGSGAKFAGVFFCWRAVASTSPHMTVTRSISSSTSTSRQTLD